MQEREVAGSEVGGVCREHAAKGFKCWAIGRCLSCHLGSPVWPFLLSLFLLTVAGFSRTLYSMWWPSWLLLNFQGLRPLSQYLTPSLFRKKRAGHVTVTNPTCFRLNPRRFITFNGNDTCSSGRSMHICCNRAISRWAQQADPWGLPKLLALVSTLQSLSVQGVVSTQVRVSESMVPGNAKVFFVLVTFKVAAQLKNCHSRDTY